MAAELQDVGYGFVGALLLQHDGHRSDIRRPGHLKEQIRPISQRDMPQLSRLPAYPVCLESRRLSDHAGAVDCHCDRLGTLWH